MEQLKRSLRFFLGIPITILSFLFIFKIFYDNRQIVIDAIQNFNPLLCIIGIFFFALFFFIKSIVWIEILRIRGHSINSRTTIFNYSISEIKRYIPGSIFAVIGRVDSHSNTIPKKETLKAFAVEAGLMAASAFLFSLPAIYYFLDKSIPKNFITFIISTIFVITLTAFLRFKKLRGFTRYFPLLLFLLLAWAFFSLGSFFIAISFTFLNPINMIFILSFFTFSWLLGYLFFITPMGLGVRELSLVFTLSFFGPVGIASAIAILTRLGMIVGELFYFLVIFSIRKFPTHSKILKINAPLAIVTTFTLAYFILFSTLSVMRHSAFLTGRFDLGNMSQTVWNTSRGNFFMLTNPDGIQQISRLGIHSDFILIFFAPFYLFFPTPIVLLIVQSLAIGIGGIFVYLISKKIIKNEKIAIVLSFSYLANFWIHQQNLFDFHAVTIATSALLASFHFLLKKNFPLFLISLLIAVLTKENVFLVAAIFGGYLFFNGYKKAGISLSIVSFATFLFLAGYAIPNARGTEHFALSYYEYLGKTPQDIIVNFFTRPHILFSHIFSLSTLNYFHELLIPTGYLALLSPLYLIFTLPDFAIYLLSSNQNLRTHHYHYGALIVPFIYIATIYSVRFILEKRKSALNFLFYYLLFTSLISCYLYSPLPVMREADYRMFTPRNIDLVKKYLTLIPNIASVAASNNIGAHLSNRDKIYVVPHGIEIADYIILYGENDQLKGKVNTLQYETLIADKKINFYIYKRTRITVCQNCKP